MFEVLYGACAVSEGVKELKLSSGPIDQYFPYYTVAGWAECCFMSLNCSMVMNVSLPVISRAILQWDAVKESIFHQLISRPSSSTFVFRSHSDHGLSWALPDGGSWGTANPAVWLQPQGSLCGRRRVSLGCVLWCCSLSSCHTGSLAV